MISIVVPAHNESSVIARNLNAWVSHADPGELEIIVVCNGCTDNTSEVARRFGPAVRVIESDVASKTHALNLGDKSARGFPRIYADADIILTVDAIRALVHRLDQGDVFVVAPTADVNLTNCSWPVRRYFEIRAQLPSAKEGIGGSGVYCLSESGRKRFSQFPDVIADDTFVRLQFKPHERATLATVKSTVFPACRIRQLIAVRTRAYAGTFQLSRYFPELESNKSQSNDRALMCLIFNPRYWLGLFSYFYVNIVARIRARVSLLRGSSQWARDLSSRVYVTNTKAEPS